MPLQSFHNTTTLEKVILTRKRIAQRGLASRPYFSACACALGRGEGEGRKNTSGDYCTVFVSPAVYSEAN